MNLQPGIFTSFPNNYCSLKCVNNIRHALEDPPWLKGIVPGARETMVSLETADHDGIRVETNSGGARP